MMQHNLMNDKLNDVLVDLSILAAEADHGRHQVLAELTNRHPVIGGKLKSTSYSFYQS
jgi:hypothetical protein